MTATDRRWPDADRELVVSVLWTRALQGGNAGVALERQPAGDAPQHLWGDAAALLDALAAAGLLRDPDHDTQVRATALREHATHLRDMAREAHDRAAEAERAADHLSAELDRIANNGPSVEAARRDGAADEMQHAAARLAHGKVWADPFGRWTAEQAEAAGAQKQLMVDRLLQIAAEHRQFPTPTTEEGDSDE